MSAGNARAWSFLSALQPIEAQWQVGSAVAEQDWGRVGRNALPIHEVSRNLDLVSLTGGANSTDLYMSWVRKRDGDQRRRGKIHGVCGRGQRDREGSGLETEVREGRGYRVGSRRQVGRIISIAVRN